ncbi:MAG: GNAT family N-acetyltransferase, partial [Acidobacteria bacterium]|nr:GNAT family N-acetyltransferase [Acidobacteriota bacterium]
MEIQLRLATAEDIPALDQLMRQSVRQLSAGYYTERQIEISLVHVFGIDTQLIADGTYFVAEAAESSGAESRIAGCGGWSKRRTLYGGDQTKHGEDNLLDPATEPARIRAFFVAPDFARRGIGRQLMEACEAAARAAGFTNMQLGATLPGVPLYAALGYQPI